MKPKIRELNLKKLNENILPIHFKMDTIQSCINLMKKNCFMPSLDLTDAYYAVSIAKVPEIPGGYTVI